MGWIFESSDLIVDEVREDPDLARLLPEIQCIVDGFPLGATAYNREFDFCFLEDRGLVFGRKLPCPMKAATSVCKLPAVKPGSDYKWPKVQEACFFLLISRILKSIAALTMLFMRRRLFGSFIVTGYLLFERFQKNLTDCQPLATGMVKGVMEFDVEVRHHRQVNI